jgi:hydrogenase expression/formation protein HypC
MCLAVPGKIIELDEKDPMRMGKVDFGGIIREASLAYVPEARLGDYVIVHAGFAISQLDEEDAHETLRLLEEISVIEQEMAAAPQGDVG